MSAVGDGRPLFPPQATSYDSQGRYVCEVCRWPSCEGKGCSVPRPQASQYHVDILPHWWCTDCREKANIGKMTRCTTCSRMLPESAFAGGTKTNPKSEWRCEECQHPPCRKCGQRLRQVWNQGSDATPYCSDRCKFPPCAGPGCNEKRPRGTGGGNLVEWHANPDWRCKTCRKPCEKCGKFLPSKWNGHGTAYCSEECKYPPCAGCAAPRPRSKRQYLYHHLKHWFCQKCNTIKGASK